MNAITDDHPPQPARRNRGQVELALASGLLAFGLFLLPAVIYAVGSALLGPYGDNQGIGAFYADFFRDLAEPALRTWAIALGPLALVSAIRLLWVRRRDQENVGFTDDHAAPQPRAIKASERERIEPRVSVD